MRDLAGAHYAQSPDASTTSVGDRVVLYHRLSRTALVLNPTATRLWLRMGTRQTVPALVSALCEQYPALPREQAARDVDALIADLSQHAFVSVDR